MFLSFLAFILLSWVGRNNHKPLGGAEKSKQGRKITCALIRSSEEKSWFKGWVWSRGAESFVRGSDCRNSTELSLLLWAASSRCALWGIFLLLIYNSFFFCHNSLVDFRSKNFALLFAALSFSPSPRPHLLPRYLFCFLQVFPETCWYN